MLAEQNEFIANASSTVYQLSQDEMIRLQCEAREDYYRRQRSVQHQINKQNELIDSQQTTIDSLQNENASLHDEIDYLHNENSSLHNEINSLKRQIADVLPKL